MEAEDLAELLVRSGVLTFGDFVTKSGRPTPFFLNFGNIRTGRQIEQLAAGYADTIADAFGDVDVLFGPAYKGIPLASALACEYAGRGRDLPLAFNRKEAKAHGEGGSLVGAPLAGRRVLIVDDVITAGTAIREALAIIRDGGGIPAGIVIALDRQERVREDATESAAQAVSAEQGIPVVAVATLADLLAFAGESTELVGHRDALRAYRARYGTGD